MKESTLKVPFVEKIIHLKKLDDGTLAFYFESFKEDEFRRLLQDLRQRGIKNITGDFVIDKTYFADKIGDSRVFDSERWRSYNALPSAVFGGTLGRVSLSQFLSLSMMGLERSKRCS